ncbi:MAG: multicopper oxidase domain-containing protein, partial [Bacillota bacterium]|nr:multicopper oxidase domain-containing protein [Bacillota bacterium]
MKLQKYVDSLPIPSVLQASVKTENYTYYEVTMKEFRHVFHRDLPPTTVWGYNGLYPGPTFEAVTGERVYVQWNNNLPDQHLLPVDHTVHGAEKDKPDVRTVVHLHGGRTEPDSDGYPDAWFTNEFQQTGPFFKKKIYEYHNLESARTLWYHDHAIGITRLNVYAGLAGFYLIRDALERSLPLPKNEFDIPLLIQDKSFHPDGSLKYPIRSKEFSGSVTPSIVPEFSGDVMTVNGKAWPFLEVEPRRYRFRLLNASNSRYINIYLEENNSFYQIATDSGFLERPIAINSLTLAPAERAEVVIDFTHLAGKVLNLRNNAPTPFPNGEPVEPDTTGSIMQFRISKKLSSFDDPPLPAALVGINWLSEKAANVSRFLELNEDKDRFGRPFMLLDKKMWDSPISENPVINSLEIWNFINLTK